jgi:hypothetical protein
MSDNYEFTLFKTTFKKYQEKFGLIGYNVYFDYTPLERHYANITANTFDAVATVRLNSRLPDKDKPHEDVKKHAKHEAIHLLLNRIDDLARARFIGSPDEVAEAIEEAVVKLETLIEDIK